MVDSTEKTQDRQRIEPIEPILSHIHPLHLLDPLMAFGLFSAESWSTPPKKVIQPRRHGVHRRKIKVRLKVVQQQTQETLIS